MKIPILLVSAFSLSFAIQATNMENSDQYYFPDKDLRIEVFKKNKGPLTECNNKKELRNVYGYFKVDAVKKMKIFQKPSSKSKVLSYLKKGDFLEIEYVDSFGWAKLKKGGWGRGHFLYPRLLPKKNRTSIKKKISRYEKIEFADPVFYKLNSPTIRVYRSATSKGKSFSTKYKIGDVLEVDKATKYGWLHIKNKGWAKGSKLTKTKGDKNEK